MAYEKTGALMTVYLNYLKQLNMVLTRDIPLQISFLILSKS